MKTRFTNVQTSVSAKIKNPSILKSKYKYLRYDSPQDKQWDLQRNNTQLLDELLMRGDELDILRYAERVQNCSKSLLFALEANDEGELKHRLKSVFFCRFRHCPVCQARRSRRNYVKFLKSLPDVLKDNPNARWVFLTLTVPNVPVIDLRETLQKMNKAWNRFTQKKEFKHVLAWVKSTEITKENEQKTKRHGYAHPHFHVLLMVKSTYFKDAYVNRDQWLRSWCKAYRDDSIVAVDVRIADRHKGQKLTGQSLVKSVSELLKYSVKPSDMLQDRDWIVLLIRQVRGMRFLSAGGLLKGVFVDEPTTAEMIHADDELSDLNDDKQIVTERQITLLYLWQRLKRRYARKV